VVQALKRERTRKGISLNELAQRAGLSQSFLSRLEKDERQPTLNTFFRLCAALEVDAPSVLAAVKKPETTVRR
jgi:XRE family transcriptional regulator, regulator of sulfur utilization